MALIVTCLFDARGRRMWDMGASTGESQARPEAMLSPLLSRCDQHSWHQVPDHHYHHQGYDFRNWSTCKNNHCCSQNCHWPRAARSDPGEACLALSSPLCPVQDPSRPHVPYVSS